MTKKLTEFINRHMARHELLLKLDELKQLFPDRIFLLDLEKTLVDFLYYTDEFLRLSEKAEIGEGIHYFTGLQLKSAAKNDKLKEIDDNAKYYFFLSGDSSLRRSLENSLYRLSTFCDKVTRHINSWSGLHLTEKHARLEVVKDSLRVKYNTPSFHTALEKINQGVIRKLCQMRQQFVHASSPEFDIEKVDGEKFKVSVKDARDIFSSRHISTFNILTDLTLATVEMIKIVQLLTMGVNETRSEKRLFN